MGPSVNIPQDALALMSLIWSLIAVFVNERKTGSVTLHFVEGKIASSEEKKLTRF